MWLKLERGSRSEAEGVWGRHTASPQLAEGCGHLSRSSSSHTGASRGKLPPNTVAKTDKRHAEDGSQGAEMLSPETGPWLVSRKVPTIPTDQDSSPS